MLSTGTAATAIEPPTQESQRHRAKADHTDQTGLALLGKYGCRVGFWRAFRGFSGSAQAWLVTLFTVGVLLLSAGLWGELYPPSWWPHWWKNLGYGLNILASFTSFLIGLPVALVVLETIKSNAVQKQQIESVKRISNVAWSDFHEAVNDLCSEQRINAIKSTKENSSPAELLWAEHNVIVERIRLSHDTVKQAKNDGLKITDEITALKSFLQDHLPIFRAKIKLVDVEFGSEYIVRRKWRYMLALWDVLDTHVRLRRIEFQLEPMYRDFYVRVLDDVNSTNNPIFEFLDAHKGASRTTGNAIESMRDLNIVVGVLLSLHTNQLAKILGDDDSFKEIVGPSRGVADYDRKCFNASTFLSFFKQNVDCIGMSGFPEKRTSPKTPKQAG
ncbi:hypothetical protein [Mycobacterium riyadhense]|uniref:hypothetical protein n=1 Tax=Mycobacterium riyadhense TaxID=486698 RepID=UPI00195BD557|nr:hypothetical protein [Mycobacterium riyadhense]